MQESSNGRYIDISLPAERDMMIVVRLAASGVLARWGLTLDALGEVKMAVEEACSCLISQITGAGRLEVVFETGDDCMWTRLACAESCAMGGEMDPSELEVARCILESLADDVVFTREDGHVTAIALRAALPR